MELNICERRLFKLTLFCIHLHPTTRQWLSKLNNSVRKWPNDETKLWAREKNSCNFGKKELLNIVLGEILQIQRQKWFSASVQVILLLMTCSPKYEVPFIQNKLHTSSLQCDLQCKELEQKIWKCCKGCVRKCTAWKFIWLLYNLKSRLYRTSTALATLHVIHDVQFDLLCGIVTL